jgi:hypothetical protein
MKPQRRQPAAPVSKPSNWPVVLPALILGIVLIFRVVSISTFRPLFDESITRDVVTGLWHGQWSNNWKYTVKSQDYRVDMYNFSSYMYADGLLAGTASYLAPARPDGTPDLLYWSRLLSCMMGTLAIYLFYLVARRLFGDITAWIAMALLAVMPLLVQDAHYARPEAFTLLLIGAAYLYLLRFDSHRERLRYAGYASFLFGLSIACKISLVPMAVLPALFLARLADRRAIVRAAAICSGCTLLGCFIGVPDAFFHPVAYWRGVEFLRHQYATGTLPHAEIDSANSVRLTALYFWETTGILLLFSAAGAFLLARGKRFVELMSIAAPVIFYLVYFCLQRTFFERNLSHVAPLMAILAGVGITAVAGRLPAKFRTAALVGLLALTAAPAVWVSGQLVFVAMRTSPEIRAVEYQRGVFDSVGRGMDYVQALVNDVQFNAMIQLAQEPRHDYLVRLVDYHDDFTRKNLEELRRRTNWREVGYFPSLFDGMSVNTLIAYHSWAYRYLFLPGPQHTR